MSETEHVVFKMTDWSRDKILELNSRLAVLQSENERLEKSTEYDYVVKLLEENVQLRELCDKMASSLCKWNEFDEAVEAYEAFKKEKNK